MTADLYFEVAVHYTTTTWANSVSCACCAYHCGFFCMTVASSRRQLELFGYCFTTLARTVLRLITGVA